MSIPHARRRAAWRTVVIDKNLISTSFFVGENEVKMRFFSTTSVKICVICGQKSRVSSVGEKTIRGLRFVSVITDYGSCVLFRILLLPGSCAGIPVHFQLFAICSRLLFPGHSLTLRALIGESLKIQLYPAVIWRPAFVRGKGGRCRRSGRPPSPGWPGFPL